MYINVSEGIYYVENPEAEGFSEIAPYCLQSTSMFWFSFGVENLREGEGEMGEVSNRSGF